MLDALLSADQALFQTLNGNWYHPWLDALMPHWREKTTWIPFYLLLVFFLVKRLGWKQTGWVLLAVGLTVLLADQTSSGLLKPWVERIRPCRALESARVLVPCGGGYSFTSSHACNHFALVAVLYGLLRHYFPTGVWVLLWCWAGSIAYGQVYVGVHYPLDVIVGGLLGSGLGWAVAQLLMLLQPYHSFSNQTSTT